MSEAASLLLDVPGPSSPPVRRSDLAPGWMLGALVALLVPFLIVQGVAVVLGHLALGLVLSELAVLGAGALVLAKLRGGLARTFPLAVPRASVWGGLLLFSLGLLAAQSLLLRAMVAWVPGTDAFLQMMNQVLMATQGWGLPSALAVIALTPAVAEELLFRGVVFTSLRARRGPLFAVLGSSALFGLFHLEPHHMLIAFGLGLFLGWARWVTGSLLPSMVLHALNNGLAVLAMKGVLPEDSRWSAPALAALLIAGVVGVVWLLRARPTPRVPPMRSDD